MQVNATPAAEDEHVVPALRVDGLHKRYGKAVALEALSVTVAPGVAFGLAGLNGAGKTTLIKCLLDFCATDAGRIELFGVGHRLTTARKRLAFLPERFIPPYYLAGRDFLRYMLTLYGVGYDPERVEAMLQALDLDPSALVKPVRTFSKGMTQKLGLAACLLSGRDQRPRPQGTRAPQARTARSAQPRTHPVPDFARAGRHRGDLRAHGDHPSRSPVLRRLARRAEGGARGGYAGDGVPGPHRTRASLSHWRRGPSGTLFDRAGSRPQPCDGKRRFRQARSAHRRR